MAAANDPASTAITAMSTAVTAAQRGMGLVARVVPQPVLQRLASMAAKRRKGNKG